MGEPEALPPPPRIGDDEFPPPGVPLREWKQRQGSDLATGALVGSDRVNARLTALGRLVRDSRETAGSEREQLGLQLNTVIEDVETEIEVLLTLVGQLPRNRLPNRPPTTALAGTQASQRLEKIHTRLSTLRELVSETGGAATQESPRRAGTLEGFAGRRQ